MVTLAKSPSPVLPAIQMSQSGVMIAALLGGFVIYLLIQGRLAVYYNLLIGGAGASTPAAPVPSPSTATPPGTTPPGAPLSPFGIPGM